MSPYMMGLAAPSPVSANIRVFHSESGGTTAQTKVLLISTSLCFHCTKVVIIGHLSHEVKSD